MMSTELFFMVWNPNRGAPSVKHATRAEAKAEAERLATKQPGDTFYILRSRDAVKVEKKPDREALRLAMIAASKRLEDGKRAYDAAWKTVTQSGADLCALQAACDRATYDYVQASGA